MLSGWEWIVILGVAVIVILWGPAKIPELAKALGKAKGEFDKASLEYKNAALEQMTSNQPVKKQSRSDEGLNALADKYAIETEGKSDDEISKEIIERIKEPQSS